MNRRAYISAGASTFLCGVTGCTLRGSHIDVPAKQDTDPDRKFQFNDEKGPNAWAQLGYDPGNTNYASGVTGPGKTVALDWSALDNQGLFPPVVAKDIYICERSGVARRLRNDDGSERWKNTSLPPLHWSPALNGNLMFVMSRVEPEQARIHALDGQTGEEDWSRPVSASSTFRPPSGPTVTTNHIFLGSETGVLCLESQEGEVVWRANLRDHMVESEEGRRRRTDWPTPAVTKNHVFTFEANTREGPKEVFSINRENGDLEWRTTIDLERGWRFKGHVVAGDEHVFVHASETDWIPLSSDESVETGGTHRVYMIDSDSGDAEQIIEFQGALFGPAAFAEGVLYAGNWHPQRGVGELVAFDVEQKEPLWTYETNAGPVSTPAVTSQIMFLSQGTELAAISTETGEPRWEIDIDGLVYPPIVANETVYPLAGYRLSIRDSESQVIAIRET